MRFFVRSLLLLAACHALLVVAAGDDLASVVQKVADVERQLPWFWCPPMEGAGDIPYTYEMKETYPKRSMRLERIPLEGGSYYRCLEQNGAAPCADEIVKALELDSKKAANFTPEEKAKAAAAHEGRRQRRKAFWTDFPTAFHFERVSPTEISFTPTGKYRPQREPDTGLLTKMKGAFRFNPDTFEITRMEYDILANDEVVWRLYKGSRVSVDLAQLADGHYLPLRVDMVRKLPKGGIETSFEEFSNYRRFATDSSVQFVDKDK